MATYNCLYKSGEPFTSPRPCDEYPSYYAVTWAPGAEAATQRQERRQREGRMATARERASNIRKRAAQHRIQVREQLQERRKRLNRRARQLRQQGYSLNEAQWYANQEAANYPEDQDPYASTYTGQTVDPYTGQPAEGAIGMGPALPTEIGGTPTTTIDSDDELAPGTGPVFWQQGLPFMEQTPVGVPMPVVLGGLAAIALGIALLR